jgi:hypothetical protein
MYKQLLKGLDENLLYYNLAMKFDDSHEGIRFWHNYERSWNNSIDAALELKNTLVPLWELDSITRQVDSSYRIVFKKGKYFRTMVSRSISRGTAYLSIKVFMEIDDSARARRPGLALLLSGNERYPRK